MTVGEAARRTFLYRRDAGSPLSVAMLRLIARTFCLGVTPCLCAALCAPSPAQPAEWARIDGSRWSARVGGWSFVIDASRGRLTEANPPGGGNVLLHGGHRGWLGPQTEWPRFWPPPSEWEEAPAAAEEISEDGRLLALHLPQGRLGLPALSKLYRTTPDSIEIGLSWRDESRSWQAVQILQVRTDAVVSAQLHPMDGIPAGFGLLPLARRPGLRLGTPPPPQLRHSKSAGSDTPACATVQFDGTEEKIGFAPQPLRVAFPGGYGLELLPSRVSGGSQTGTAPDDGLYTQIYLGADRWPLVEVEQLSPRLLPSRPAPERIEVWSVLRPLPALANASPVKE